MSESKRRSTTIEIKDLKIITEGETVPTLLRSETPEGNSGCFVCSCVKKVKQDNNTGTIINNAKKSTVGEKNSLSDGTTLNTSPSVALGTK